MNPAQALAQIPVLRSLGEPAERVRERAERLCRRLGGELTETTAKVKFVGNAQLDVSYDYQTVNGRAVAVSERRSAELSRIAAR